MNRKADRRFKYHHIVDVLLAASAGDTPTELARQVRDRYPRGQYEPVRICEDIGRILRKAGNFTTTHVALSDLDLAKIRRLRDDLKRRRVWLTRSTL